MKESVERMWAAYLTAAALPPETALPPVWHFCDNQADADECAALVLAGQKRATAPSLWGLMHRGEEMPAVGSHDLVTTWDGEACAVIRTTRVDVVPFSDVTADHALAEGEGDGTLEWWRRIHHDYYARELADTHYVPTPDMPIVYQYFEVVHR